MKNFKNIFSKDNLFKIIMLLFLLSYITLFIFYNINKEEINNYKAKVNILNKTINKKSDIQILKEEWTTASNKATSLLKKIEQYKYMIEEAQRDYEYNVLVSRCSKDQISRMIDWLEYNINYCKDSKNLESFRTKKY